MVVVAVIGPIAAGKSVVLAALADLGAAVIQADDISREILQPGRPELEAVRQAFGDEFINPDGSLRRPALAELIFADPAARQRLNDLVHPSMARRITECIQQYRNSPHPPPLIAVEAAVLLEMGLQQLVDKLILVDAPAEVRVQRLMQRDGLAPDEAQRRVAVHDQLGLDQVEADYVIQVVGPLESTRQQTAQLWPGLLDEDDDN